MSKSHLLLNRCKAELLIARCWHSPLKLKSDSPPFFHMSILVTLNLPGAQARNCGVILDSSFSDLAFTLFANPFTCPFKIYQCSKYFLTTFRLLSGPSLHFSRGLFPCLPYWSFWFHFCPTPVCFPLRIRLCHSRAQNPPLASHLNQH